MSHRMIGPGAGWVVATGLIGALAACQRQPQPDETPAAAPVAVPALATAPAPAVSTALVDVVERTPTYLVGISFPKHLEAQPGLIELIRRYAEDARGQLQQAVAALGSDKPTAPYELSLSFDTVLDTPELIVIAAEGGSYTGGAHGQPLVARFVWLKRLQKRMQAADLLADPAGWTVVSREAAARLHEAALARAQAEGLSPEQLAAQLRSADRAIAEGTAAEPGNFAEFEPVIAADGRIGALRFLFPPYQVGPYADGTQSVEVPAALLRPLLAAEYAGFFSGT